ncbi:hypothetical protein [Portibacter marinus]|uniref:hypothetical protein n=1 Tax=Portibacter marinus TaxID=2898660 RepID=UPI001F3FCCA3|nr:hypothetical protein [Portibacter marinus]
MKTIVIQINNHNIRLGVHTNIPIEKSNLPAQAMTFKSSALIFWEAEMISYSKSTKRLRLRVVKYDLCDGIALELQQSKYEIQSVHFEPLHWKSLEPLLTTYQKSQLSQILAGPTEINSQPHLSKIYLKVPLSKLSFGMGQVRFHRAFHWRRPETEIAVSHPDSIPEFEHIKFYFTKILGKGTLEFTITVESTKSSSKIKYVTSKDLQKINTEAVRVLKISKMNEWATKKPKLEQPDKALFTFDDAMKSYGDEALGNIDSLEKDLLFHLLEKKSVRNKMQLRYLSEQIHDVEQKLLMTLVPQFGFMIVHKGQEMLHYVWELLNSHATYIWSIPRYVEFDPIKVIENEIQTITVHGRQFYRDHFEPSETLYFNTIRHKASHYSYEQYFARWKKELDALLI